MASAEAAPEVGAQAAQAEAENAEEVAAPATVDPAGASCGDGEGGFAASPMAEPCTPAGLSADAQGSETAVVAKEAVPEGTLSFKCHMWDRFEFLWQRRVEPAVKLLEQVAAVLRSRAKLERAYANSLVNFQGQVKLDAESSSTMQNAVGTVLCNFRNRGEQSRELADQIENDVAVTFEDVAAQHREVYAKMQMDATVLSRYVQDSQKAYSRLAARYGVRCAEAELAAREVLQGLAMKAKSRTQLAMRVATMGLQARDSEAEYYAGMQQANKAQAVYNAHMPSVLQALQEIEERSQLCLRDGLRKLAVYEMSWLRNMEYDVAATVKTSEEADPEADLQEFLRESWDAQGQRAPASDTVVEQLKVQPFWELGRAKPPRETPARKFLREDDAYIRTTIDEIQPLVKTVMTEQGGTAKVPDPVAQLQNGLTDHRRRAALCQVLRAQVLTHEPQGTEIDNAKPVTIDLLALEALAQVFTAALDGCDEAGETDAWNGRDLMVLAQLFKAEMEGGKSTSLLSRVYSHRLWSKVPFWEEVLLIGLCEAHAAEVIWRRSLAPGCHFVNPSMTSFLDRFVGHMLTFGIRLEQARNAVSATIRKNSALLGAMGKPYETLLLKAYEAAAAAPDAAAAAAAAPGDSPAAASSAAAGAPTEDGARAPVPASGEAAGAAALAPAAAATAAAAGGDAQADGRGEEDEDDDFEAVALGLSTAPAPGGLAEDVVGSRSHTDVFG
eukprot:TRINITY_DN3905_c0_g1_i1.p1 TRINITY_DN3905_c0_g1~~TRINITY_DN3905_c0_g1_i1.p1  ORF type:complete len:743 (+),score=166.50 TRINITY_DN3905_c0_g1_i1:51-2231(+)